MSNYYYNILASLFLIGVAASLILMNCGTSPPSCDPPPGRIAISGLLLLWAGYLLWSTIRAWRNELKEAPRKTPAEKFLTAALLVLMLLIMAAYATKETF